MGKMGAILSVLVQMSGEYASTKHSSGLVYI